MRPADGGRRGLRKPVAADLSLGDQFGKAADGLLDRRVRVHAVLVVEVDVVRAEALERALDGQAHVLWRAVHSARTVASMQEGAPLRSDDNLIPASGDRLAEQFLVEVRAIDLGGVEEVHSEFERAMDRRDRRRIVLAGSGVEGAHAHEAEPDSTDLGSIGS